MRRANKFDCLTQDLATGNHRWGKDNWMVLLTNTAPSPSATTLAELNEIAPGNGYAAGGFAVANASVSSAEGITKVTGENIAWTASGGKIGPFRYAVLYSQSPAGIKVIGWEDYGAAVTVAPTQTFTISFDDLNGIVSMS